MIYEQLTGVILNAVPTRNYVGSWLMNGLNVVERVMGARCIYEQFLCSEQRFQTSKGLLFKFIHYYVRKKSYFLTPLPVVSRIRFVVPLAYVQVYVSLCPLFIQHLIRPN